MLQNHFLKKQRNTKRQTRSRRMGGSNQEDLENLVKQTTWLQNLANGDMDAIYGLIGAGEGGRAYIRA